MDIVFLIGRILFGGFFIMTGMNHFTKSQAMTQYAQSKGVAAPALAVFVGGLLLLAGGLSVLLGAYVSVGLWLLVIFLVPTSFLMHNFWAVSDPNAKMGEMTNFMKNMALTGAALMLLLLETPWAYALNL